MQRIWEQEKNVILQLELEAQIWLQNLQIYHCDSLVTRKDKPYIITTL